MLDLERLKVRVESLEELRRRVCAVEEFTQIINAKETDLRASCDLNFDIFTKGIHQNHHTSNQNKGSLEQLWMELKKYKDTLREDPDPYDDNEVKQDMHRLELRVRDCEAKMTPPNAVPLGLCSGNWQQDGRHGGKVKGPEQAQEVIKEFDLDGDGKLDRNEVMLMI